ncbi:MAG: methylmalonyl-CoA mutase [Candidatus Aminicenantes bacterium]|nr:methylmalonyl-CoA mutase [Candidatus Aminicenantes bacterium]
MGRAKLKRIYSHKDIPSPDFQKNLGDSGEYPFTRGVYPSMYRGKLWTMRQYAGFGTARESNKRYRFLLSKGQTGLSVAFDLPTQLGLDSDHPQSLGEVGKVGVAIDSLRDMEILFDQIPLHKVSVSMTINSTAAIILAMYLALAESKGLSGFQLSGTIQNDILKEFIARGTYIFPPESSMKIIHDTLVFCQEHMPKWNTMSISGYHIREAGATAVQELAFTLANAVTYVQAAVDAGLDVDSFAPRLSFFLAAHNNFFEEIAKFRAARRLWAKVMKEKFKAENPKSWKFRFHTQTSGATLTAQEPENNVIRVTLQALSSVLGGTQSLHTNSRDEALALPSEESAKIALRTQQIIAFETGVPDVVDPMGGSYLVEHLTHQIEEQVNQYLEKIKDMGGMPAAIDKGYVQKEIQNSAFTHQKQLENHERDVIGVNKYQTEEHKHSFEIYYPPKRLEKNQIKQLNDVKKTRSDQKLQSSLNSLRSAAKSDKNLMPHLLDCVKKMATVGEITAVLKEIYGTYRERIIF